MTRKITSLFVFCSLIGMAACHKDAPTFINATLVDAKSGKALQGAGITYSTASKDGSNGGGNKISDMNGAFNIELGPGEHFRTLEISKNGYVDKLTFGTPYELGKRNDLQVKLHPIDAVLRVTYSNSYSFQRRVYLQAQSQSYLEDYDGHDFVVTKPYPNKSDPFQIETIDYPIVSDEPIFLYWGLSMYAFVNNAPNKDTLYVNKGDTVTYSIAF